MADAEGVEAIDPTSTIKDFDILQQVGSGTFCVVNLCRKKDSGRVFVVKQLSKKKIVYLKQVVHVTQEVEILRQVDNPFIVRLFHTMQDETNLYMVLEFACGGELFTHMRDQGNLNEGDTRFFIGEIALLLQYLHDLSIAYRDLKPENILIDRQGHVKLTDFGFAKILGPEGTTTMCGTPEYLAPEIIRGEVYDRNVDWWALGILMYEMLAGFPPFYDEENDNPVAIYTKILNGQVKFPSGMELYAKDLIKRFLMRDVSQRLGNLEGGAEDVKRHRFFRGTDWVKLAAKEVAPPIIPRVNGPTDSSYFEIEELEPENSQVEKTTVAEGLFTVFN